MATCARGHDIRGPEDRLRTGACRECNREDQRIYREKCNRERRAGVALLEAVNGRGMSVGEAITLLQRADYWELQKCQEG